MIFGSRKNSAAQDANTEESRSALPTTTPDERQAGKVASQQQEEAPAKSANVEQRRRRAVLSLSRSAAFTQIVTLLMRSPIHKHLSLGDLEWLVVPPLMTGQFRIAKLGSRKAGVAVPAAAVLWASLSTEVDAKLSASPKAPIRLRPDEWRSGDILWLVEAVGDPRVVSRLLKELNDKTFKGREVKVRAREAGNPAIDTLHKVISKSRPN